MERIRAYFEGLPVQAQVAMELFRRGVSVRDGTAYCGGIEVGDTAIARALNVDRRVVRSTLDRIDKVPDLQILYSKLESMLLLSDAASQIGCSALEVVPIDASVPGIMAGILKVLSDAGINVRQAVVSDPGDLANSHLIIVADGEISGMVMAEVRGCRGVDSVIIR